MYGREGELSKLNRDRNNTALSFFVRERADRAHKKIVDQLKDKKLMGLREQLIKATRAGDQEASVKIQLQMRAHTGEEMETGQ